MVMNNTIYKTYRWWPMEWQQYLKLNKNIGNTLQIYEAYMRDLHIYESYINIILRGGKGSHRASNNGAEPLIGQGIIGMIIL